MKCERCETEVAEEARFSDPRCNKYGVGVVLCEDCSNVLLIVSDTFLKGGTWTADHRNRLSIRYMFDEVEGFKLLDGEDCAMAVVRIFGVPHHVTFVRVERDEEGVQHGTRDPYGRLDDILTGADGVAETVKLPGQDGQWVVGVDPFRR